MRRPTSVGLLFLSLMIKNNISRATLHVKRYSRRHTNRVTDVSGDKRRTARAYGDDKPGMPETLYDVSSNTPRPSGGLLRKPSSYSSGNRMRTPSLALRHRHGRTLTRALPPSPRPPLVLHRIFVFFRKCLELSSASFLHKGGRGYSMTMFLPEQRRWTATNANGQRGHGPHVRTGKRWCTSFSNLFSSVCITCA